MAKDKKERENDNLEQFGVWVKTGSDGIEEIEAQSIEIDDNPDEDQLYITDEEEDLLNELHSSEEDGDLDSLDFSDLEDEDFDPDSEELDFSDLSSIEDTIEDSLPDFGDMEVDTNPLEQAVDKLEEQTGFIEKSSRELDILEKIESELSSIRTEIKDLKNEISTIKMVSPEESALPEAGEEISGEEQEAQGFFDDSDLDETIALTGDELDNILDETLAEEQEALSIEEGSDFLTIPDEEPVTPEETLPEDHFQDEADLLQDTPLEETLADDLELPDEDPALSMLTNIEIEDDGKPGEDEEEWDIPEEPEDGGTLEITIDDEGEAEEDISLDNLEDISLEEISLDDIGDSDLSTEPEDEVLEISNDDEEIISIDDVDENEELSDDIEEIDIDDIVESSPDDDLEIEEVDLGDLGIDIEEFHDDDETEEIPEALDDEDELPIIDEADEPEELSEEEDTLFDEGEEVTFDTMDDDIVFEDEGSFSESDEIESVDLSELSEESEEISDTEALDDLETDEISLDDFDMLPDETDDDEGESVEPLSDLNDEEGSIDFEDIEISEIDLDDLDSLGDDEEISLDEETIEMESFDETDEFTEIGEVIDEEEEALEFPESDVAEFPLPADEPEDEEEDLAEALSIEIDDEIELEDMALEEEPEEEPDEELIIEEELGEEIVFDEIPAEEIEIDEEDDLNISLDETILDEEDDDEEEFLDLDLDLDDVFDADEPIAEETAEEVVGESFSIEIEEEKEAEEEVGDELETAPVEDLSIDDDNIEDLLDGISLSDDLGEFGESTELDEPVESRDIPDLEAGPEPERAKPLRDEMPLDSAAILNSTELKSLPYDLKEEIKEVLTYMDQLLEALPEDKIQEFARSEHFEVYKKIFTELGITK